MKLLFIDDNEDILEVFTEMIECYGDDIEIVSKSRVDQAVELLKNEKFDIVLTDYNLSKDDIRGSDFVKWLYDNNLARKIGVLSGESVKLDLEEKENLKVQVFSKPVIDFYEFVNKIKNN